ncbi:hypothetical protein BHM03_00005151 [Ensete ventricosum]|nr:hypothetical protein BHM03_00005151 [Ensete ventricosum]
MGENSQTGPVYISRSLPQAPVVLLFWLWRSLPSVKTPLNPWRWVIGGDRSGAIRATGTEKLAGATPGSRRTPLARFFAQYHDLPCDIPLPDPDMYIDEVDHDAPVDPELVADLEKQPSVPTDVQSVAPGLSDYWDMCGVEAIQPTGWDDEVEPEPRNQDIKDGVGNSWNDSGGGHWDEAAAQNDPWSNGRNNWVLIKQKIVGETADEEIRQIITMRKEFMLDSF